MRLLLFILCFFPSIAFNQKIITSLSDGNNVEGYFGAIQSIDLNTGIVDTIHNFIAHPKGNLTNELDVLVDSNGKIYGVSSASTNSSNTLFSFDTTTKIFENLVNLSAYNIVKTHSIVFDNNGDIIGNATIVVNSVERGVVYRYNVANNLFEILYDFTVTSTTLKTPTNRTVLYNNETYFVCQGTGQFAAGTIYKINQQLKIEPIADFPLGYDCVENGGIELINDEIYFPGSFGILKFNFTTEVLELIPFSGISNATYGGSGFVLHSDGNIYMICGDIDLPDVYLVRFNTSNLTFEVVHTGDYMSIGNPYNVNCLSFNEEIFMLSKDGGINYQGNLSKFNTLTNIYNPIYEFDATSGTTPNSFEEVNGNLYGLTPSGGSFSNGYLFKYDIALENFSVLQQNITSVFTYSANQGIRKFTNDEIYAFNTLGGPIYQGAVYVFNSGTESFDTLRTFTTAQLGGQIYNIYELQDGFLLDIYLSSLQHSLKKYNPLTNTLTFIKNIYLDDIGQSVLGRISIIDNQIYGYTENYLTDKQVYKINPMTRLCESVALFPNNEMVLAGLTKTLNNKLFGVTKNGGSNNVGYIYEIDTVNNVIVPKVNFSSVTQGSNCSSTFIEGLNSKLYTTCKTGGTGGYGTLIEYDYITNTCLKKQDFNTITGYGAIGDLCSVGGNIFYGVTYSGNLIHGKVFRYDANINSIIALNELLTFTTGGLSWSGLVKSSGSKFIFNCRDGSGNAQVSVFDTNNNQTEKLFSYHTYNNGGHPTEQLRIEDKLYTFYSKEFDKYAYYLKISSPSGLYPDTNVFLFRDTSITFWNVITGATLGSDGLIYYTTGSNGGAGYGTIERFDPVTLQNTRIYEITAISNTVGLTKLVETGGFFYATNFDANVGMSRNIFKFDPNNLTLNTIYTFTDPNAVHISNLAVDNNRLYGTFSESNNNINNNSGSLYYYDLTNNSYNELEYLWGVNGINYLSEYKSAPLIASDGMIYFTGNNTINSKIIKFNPITSTLSDVHVFNEVVSCSELVPLGNKIISANNGMNSTSGYIYSIDPFNLDYNVIHIFDDFGIFPVDFSICDDSISFLTLNDDSLSFCEGSTLEISIQNTGSPYFVEWYRNDTIISGENGTSLVLSNLDQTDYGFYYKKVFGSCSAYYSDTVFLNVAFCDSVYPGDTDFDGVVTLSDLFTIGLFNGSAGPARTNASNLFVPQIADDWSLSTLTNLNLKHSDCNGNGFVEVTDTAAIMLNFGSTHLVLKSQIFPISGILNFVDLNTSSTNFIAGQVIEGSITIGNASLAAENIYAISALLEIETNETIENLNTDFSNISTPFTTNSLSLKKEESNKIYFASTRADQSDTNGLFTTFNFQFSLPINLNSTEQVDLYLNDIQLINELGEYHDVDGIHFKSVIVDPFIGINEISKDFTYKIVDGNIIVDGHLGKKAILIDITGKEIATSVQNKNNEIVIQIPNVTSGVYFLKLCDSETSITKRIYIDHSQSSH